MSRKNVRNYTEQNDKAHLPLWSASVIAVRWSDWVCKCSFLYSTYHNIGTNLFKFFWTNPLHFD